MNLNLGKTNQLGESSPNFFFFFFYAVVNLDPTILEKRWINGVSWPNDFFEKVNRGENLRWVGSRCPLTRALSDQSVTNQYVLLQSPIFLTFYYEPNFIEKFLRKVCFVLFWFVLIFFFKFSLKSKWHWTKIGHLAAILKPYFFSWIWLFLMHKYIVLYSLQNSAEKSVFLGGSQGAPKSPRWEIPWSLKY